MYCKRCINVPLYIYWIVDLTKSVVGQWFLVCTSSPSPDYFSHQCQTLSLYCIGRILLAGCLDVPSLKDIVGVPQSGGIDLRRLDILWLHLLQYQKGGVHQVWLITPSCIMEYRQAFFQCSQSSKILPYQARSNQCSSRGIYVLCPAWWSFFNLPIFRINFSKNDGNNGRVNMWCLQVIDITEYSALFVVNDLVHHTPVVFIFLMSHLF